MSRYIDADLLKDKTTRVNNIWNVTTNAEGKGLDEIIDDIPTADVVEVVRCKDCKSSYYDEETGAMLCDDINGMVGGVCKNAFCSYGEKNE